MSDHSWELVNKTDKWYYFVTREGEVFKVDNTERVECCPIKDNGYGYKNVSVATGKPEYIHRLVAKAFIPNPDNLKYVGHKDHNKENNHVDNLYWTTASRNTQDGIKDGKINYKGRINGKMQKHSDELLAKAYLEVKGGAGVQDTATKYGINRTTLSSWVNKRSRTDFTNSLDKTHTTP